MKTLPNHPGFSHANDMQQICRPLKLLGIEYFGHAMIDENGSVSGIGTCPEFFELYLKKDYYRFDIHQSQLQQNQRYIIWDYMPMDPKLSEVHDDFKSFSLGHGFTISYLDIKGCKHYYHFSASLGNENINKNYMKNLDSLKMFILYFNEKINSTKGLKIAHDIKFGQSNGDNSSLDRNKLNLPIDRIYFSRDVYLTLREFQCLNWLSQAKTIMEISIILSISERTTKEHISNIKNKLGCKNLFQLGLAYQTFKEINGSLISPDASDIKKHLIAIRG